MVHPGPVRSDFQAMRGSAAQGLVPVRSEGGDSFRLALQVAFVGSG